MSAHGSVQGATGFVGSTYCFAGAATNRLIAAFGRGDVAAAAAERDRIRPMMEIISFSDKYGTGVRRPRTRA
jgi:dihydrodipicolinate synthase/N-acetylneuraminate lyase